MALKKPATRLLIIICAWLAFFNVTFAERVTNFEADVSLNEDGSFIVSETIVYDFEQESRRGIYRNIKNNHTQPASNWYTNRSISLELLDVKRDGVSEPYQIEEYDGLSVRIGDSTIFHTGAHTYSITYKVDGAIALFDGFEEFYWNVTGDEWEVPIQRARLTLSAPAHVLGVEASCYQGYEGVNSSCSLQSDSSEQVVFVSGVLSPGEQMTVAQSLHLSHKPTIIETINWFVVLVPMVMLALLAIAIYLYRWKFFHKYPTTIIPQYEPLSDFKPMFTGVLFDGRLDSRDVTAGIIYLAEQGFITIKVLEKESLVIFKSTDYEVTLQRPFNEVETDFHRVLLSLLFGEGGSKTFNFVSLFTGTSTKETNTEHLVGTTVLLSKLKSNQSRLKENAELLEKLDKAVKDDLRGRGYFEQRALSLSLKSFVLIPLAIVLMIILFSFIGFLAFIALVVFAVFGFERRTKKGYEALYYLRGFKDFLSVTERDRYKMLNAPNKTPEQFMEYLPYAIAFGVEKEWAHVFADITITNPDWYQDTTSSMGSFNALAFSSAISNFSSSFTSASGTSGSSGGGSAGGGSGGGGGGSW